MSDRSSMQNAVPNMEMAYRDDPVAPLNRRSRKCYQRQMRDAYASKEPRPTIASLRGAWVKPITNQQAATIILKYEWLGTMATATVASYGLFLGEDELLGAVCFSRGGNAHARKSVNPSDPSKVVFLVRGACVHYAPKNAASFLITHACRLAHQAYGWTHFVGYSDPAAGETGQIYRACGWKQVHG